MRCSTVKTQTEYYKVTQTDKSEIKRMNYRLYLFKILLNLIPSK